MARFLKIPILPETFSTECYSDVKLL